MIAKTHSPMFYISKSHLLVSNMIIWEMWFLMRILFQISGSVSNHDQIIPHWTIGVVHFSYIPVELQRFKVHEIWLCRTSMATCASIGFWVHSCVASFPPPPHEIIQKKFPPATTHHFPCCPPSGPYR